MKNRFRTVIAAAVMVIASAACYGQTRLNADIGFPFKMQSANLPAGSYHLLKMNTGGSTVFQLWSMQAHKSVLISTRYVLDQKSGTTVEPRLVFRCTADMCALAEIWTPEGTGYAAPRPKLTPAEKERLAVVPLTVQKAD